MSSDRTGQGSIHDRPGPRGRGAERSMVPPAEFTSYYGHNVVKPSPWEHDIPAYLFAGGVAAGSSLLAAGASLTGRPALRRTGRLGALVAFSFSMVALVHDLGRPMRFLHMLRTVKLTSPMSVGTWILSVYGPFAALAALAEVAGLVPAGATQGRLRWAFRLLDRFGGPAGVVAGVTAPSVAAYTAVLLSDTATPSWHSAYRELPFVFCGSAAAASGGLGMIGAPVTQAGPARRFALGGALVELVMERRMERSMGLTAEPLHDGHAGRLMKAAQSLTVLGGVGTLLAGRSRSVAVVSGVALMAGSACTRFGIFEAGQRSAKDPKYTVVPQRERIAREGPTRYPDHPVGGP
ncbi:MAG: Formate dehydrogenase O putative subunit [uncultured Nocardioidaceae bacterium]|uniref:Formate dehydrogenase O putative subunit n=1 Tax=uncultured Nocardioidaceae bacterium TaxID=253824 RepID=A0A6J4LVX1_9ACTN|nr:MAG: Formate dehydrogenase O putative subunit [uncultured Nocardioidaceae bacterium]